MTKLFKLMVLFLVSNIYIVGFAQNEDKMFFIRSTDIPVLIDTDTMEFPWPGAFNNPQFSNIDLNQDGVQDLFVFERSDNQIFTFISNNIKGEVSFTYAPEYEHLFPKLTGWAILKDYNEDGLKDIFTSVTGGIKYYKNTTSSFSSNKSLRFQLVEKRIKSYNPATGLPAELNIPSGDIPAIDDIDGDGDIDILTFGPLGLHVEYHENQCKDKKGDCDKFDFSIVTRCWGNFAENEGDNGIEVNAECVWDSANTKLNRNNFHVGSTLTVMDYDGDNDQDLVLGDNSNKNLVLLTNGGDKDSAKITEVDYSFPSTSDPVDIDIFPTTFKVDLNNDGVFDFVAACNTREFENRTSTWYYENEGTNEKPDLKFKSNKIIQDQMIDVGYNSNPIFFDHNNDGLLDLLVSSYYFYTNDGNTKSKVYYYENIGAKDKPSFKLITEDWEDLHKDLKDSLGQSLQQTFGDLDGDGDDDMFIGTEDGELFYFENKGEAGKEANFSGDGLVSLDVDSTPMDPGQKASPDLFDLNEDGLLDLIVGERNGNLNYYENVGTKEEPKFKLTNELLGGIDISLPDDPVSGEANPKFFNRDGKIELFLGSQYGTIYYYDNISGNSDGDFNLQDSAFQDINHGFNLSLDLADINGDGFSDLAFGTDGGGVRLYLGAKYTGLDELKNTDPFELTLHPNPAKNTININFNIDLSSKFEIEITDILGKEVHEQSVLNKNEVSININNFPKGLYFVTLKNDKLKQTTRFVKGE